MTSIDTNTSAAKPRRKMAREPQATPAVQSPPKRPSKSAMILAMLERPEGATLDQLVETTGWLPHTARAELTGLKKKGNVVTSDKPSGSVRVYRIGAGVEADQ